MQERTALREPVTSAIGVAVTSELAGKVAIVSGASRGVGRAYALALAGAGAQVVALARSAEGDPSRIGSLANVSAAAAATGDRLVGWACDVADESSIVSAVERAAAEFGGVDIVVNNAVWPIHQFDALIVPPLEWEGAYKINVLAPYVFMRETIPFMIKRGGGAIINITSGAAGATKPGSGAHGFPAYGVTKAAMERLTTYFAAEYADVNIAVNAVSPGHVAYYTRNGREPDLAYWGEPLIHLATQRPGDGFTGCILHTYEYGRAWGPRPVSARAWDEDIQEMLRMAGHST